MPHISKKTKASWRKNIDITDVETFLEEQRQDERIGKVDEKPDADLFSKDVKPSADQPKLKTIRKKKFVAGPKFCLALENSSKVSDPIVRRNFVTNKEKLVSIACKHTKQLEKKYSSKPVAGKKGDGKSFCKDIWEEEEVPAQMKNEWFNENVVLHNMKHRGRPLVKVAASTHEKPNAVPNVELPVSGTSYNPSIDDYNELKQIVIDKEQKIIKKSEHLERVVTNKFIRMSKLERDQLVLKEMSEGLFENEEKTAKDVDSDDQYTAVNPPVKNKKKDRKTKNKKFRAVAKRNDEITVKTELRKLKDINRIPELKSELNKKQTKTANKQANRSIRLEEKKKAPGRVAYLQFEEAEDDFVEPTELTDSLRTLVPNKSLVADRFKSFQKRTLIAPKKHRDGISRSNKSTLKKWKRYTLSTHKEA